jgi:hypothetical protein
MALASMLASGLGHGQDLALYGGEPVIDAVLVPWFGNRLAMPADEGKYLDSFLHN